MYLLFAIAVVFALLVFHAGRSGLIVQNEQISSTLGTLASKTALSLSSVLSSTLANSFLMKRWRGTVFVDSVDDTEGPFVIGLARGNATVAEIAIAFTEANTVGRTDVTQVLTEDSAWTIHQNSVVMLKPDGAAQGTGTNKVNWIATFDISFGRKGIPWSESEGWQVFFINLSNGAMTTGAGIDGWTQAWGVWLRD